MDVILQALADGAKTIANDAATDALKSIYGRLKSLIQERWIGDPNPDLVLAGFDSKPQVWRSVLEEKLRESGISGDETVQKQARALIKECSEIQNRTSSPGDTTTSGGMKQEGAQIRNEREVFTAGRDSKKTLVKNSSLLIGFIFLITVGASVFAPRNQSALPQNSNQSQPSPLNPVQNNTQNNTQNNFPEASPSRQSQPSSTDVQDAKSSPPAGAASTENANLNAQQCPVPQQQQCPVPQQ